MLHIADNLSIPPELFAHEGKRLAALGKPGSGKTNTEAVFCEEWMSVGWPMAVIDSMGPLRKLREAGFPVIVAGMRKDADVPVSAESAPALAEFSFRERVSVVLDVSMHETGEDLEIELVNGVTVVAGSLGWLHSYSHIWNDPNVIFDHYGFCGIEGRHIRAVRQNGRLIRRQDEQP